MLKFNKEEVRKILLEELRFSKDKTKRSITILSELDDQLQPFLDQWLKDRTISNLKINGVALELVFKYFEIEKNDIIGALIYMEMFVDNNHIAEKFLRNPYLVVGTR